MKEYFKALAQAYCTNIGLEFFDMTFLKYANNGKTLIYGVHTKQNYHFGLSISNKNDVKPNDKSYIMKYNDVDYVVNEVNLF